MVLGTLGYFIIASVLLTTSGLAATQIQYPTGVGSDDPQASPKNFGQSVFDCIINIVSITAAGSCNAHVKSATYIAIANVLDWAVGAVTFLFQLATFQLPNVPTFLQILIIGPPALVMGYIGIKFARGVGG